MALGFNKLRKGILRGIKEGASIAYKPIDDSFDVVKDIIDRPYTAPLRLAQFGVKQALQQTPAGRGALALSSLVDTDALRPVTRPVFNRTMDVLNRTDDVLTGGAALYGSEFEVDPNTGRINPNWISPRELFTQSPISRFERNVGVLERQTGDKILGEGDITSFGGALKGFKNLYNTFTAAGQAFEEDPDVPVGVKFGASVLADPFTYGTGAAIKGGLKGGLRLAGTSAPELAAKYPKLATAGKAAYWGIEGFEKPKTLAGFTAGGALGAQFASNTENPYDDFFLPMITGQLGTMKLSDFERQAQMLGVKVRKDKPTTKLKDFEIIPSGYDEAKKLSSDDEYGIRINTERFEEIFGPITSQSVLDLNEEDMILYKNIFDSSILSDPQYNIFKVKIDQYEVPVLARDKKEAIRSFFETYTSDMLANNRIAILNVGKPRVFFHSTIKGTAYSDLDPEKAIMATGWSNGPGIYISSDPGHSAKWYGDQQDITESRTFALEIDPNAQAMNMQLPPNDRDLNVWKKIGESFSKKLTYKNTSDYDKYRVNFYEDIVDDVKKAMDNYHPLYSPHESFKMSKPDGSEFIINISPSKEYFNYPSQKRKAISDSVAKDLAELSSIAAFNDEIKRVEFTSDTIFLLDEKLEEIVKIQKEGFHKGNFNIYNITLPGKDPDKSFKVKGINNVVNVVERELWMDDWKIPDNETYDRLVNQKWKVWTAIKEKHSDEFIITKNFNIVKIYLPTSVNINNPTQIDLIDKTIDTAFLTSKINAIEIYGNNSVTIYTKSDDNYRLFSDGYIDVNGTKVNNKKLTVDEQIEFLRNELNIYKPPHRMEYNEEKEFITKIDNILNNSYGLTNFQIRNNFLDLIVLYGLADKLKSRWEIPRYSEGRREMAYINDALLDNGIDLFYWRSSQDRDTILLLNGNAANDIAEFWSWPLSKLERDTRANLGNIVKETSPYRARDILQRPLPREVNFKPSIKILSVDGSNKTIFGNEEISVDKFNDLLDKHFIEKGTEFNEIYGIINLPEIGVNNRSFTIMPNTPTAASKIYINYERHDGLIGSYVKNESPYIDLYEIARNIAMGRGTDIYVPSVENPLNPPGVPRAIFQGERTKFKRVHPIKQLGFVDEGVSPSANEININRQQSSPFLSLKRDAILSGAGAALGYAATGEEEGALEGAGIGFLSGGIANLPTGAAIAGVRANQKIKVGPDTSRVKFNDDPADVIYHPKYNPEGKQPELNFLHETAKITDEEAKVVTYDRGKMMDEVKRMFGRFIAPDVLMDSKIGRLLVAHRRLILKSRNVVDVVVSGLFDSYADKWGFKDITGRSGTIFKTDDNGIVDGIGAHWSTVIGNLDKYKDNLTDVQIKFAEDVIKFLEDLGTLRYYNGLDQFDPATGKGTISDTYTYRFRKDDGSIWIPRVVSSIDDIEIPKRSDADKVRLYEMIEDGINNGVNYSDIREVLKLYAQETFEDIYAKQLADELIKYSVHIDELIPKDVKDRYDNAEKALDAARAALKIAMDKKKNNPKLKTIQRTINKAVAEVNNAVEEMEEARRVFLKTKEALRTSEGGVASGQLFGRQEERIPVREWTAKFLGPDRFFAYDDYKKLVDAIGVRGVTIKEGDSHWTSKIWKVTGNTTRFLAASLDFAAPFTHGLVLLGRNPRLWAQATAEHYKAFFKTGLRDEYINNNLQSVQEMVWHGVDPADPETFAAIQHGGEIPFALHKLLKLTGNVGGSQEAKQRLLNTVFKQSFGRFSNSLNTFLLVARHEMWKAYRDQWNDKTELASWINKMTGGVNAQMLGASKTQRDWESTWLAFSPRLFRSTLALVGTALSPSNDQQAKAARRALLQLGTGATLMYIATGMALYPDEFIEDWEEAFEKRILPGLDPTNGKKFLSYKIGDTWYGIGGQVRALTQLVAAISTNPNGIADMDSDNPLITYYRGRGAPALDLSTSLVEGFTGIDANPYEDIIGPSGALKATAVSFLPLTIQAAIEGTSAAGLLAGSQGLRTSPETTRERLNEKALELYGKPLNELNKEEKDEFYQKYPPKLRNDNVSKFYTQLDAINQEFIFNVNRYATYVENNVPGFTKEGFREYYKEQSREKANKIKGLRTAFSVVDADVPNFDGSVVEYLESRVIQPEDKAVADYYKISDFFLDEETGKFDYEGYELAKEEYLSKLPRHIREYVERNTEKDEENKLVTEMRSVQEDAATYFETNNEVWKNFSNALPGSIFSMFNSYDEFAEWVEVTAQQSGVTPETMINFLRKKYPPLNKFYDIANEFKRISRLQNPSLDRSLTEWYGIEPANRIDQILQQEGITGFGELASSAYIANPRLNDINRAQSLAFSLNPINLNRRFRTQESRFAERRLAFRNLQNN